MIPRVRNLGLLMALGLVCAACGNDEGGSAGGQGGSGGTAGAGGSDPADEVSYVGPDGKLDCGALQKAADERWPDAPDVAGRLETFDRICRGGARVDTRRERTVIRNPLRHQPKRDVSNLARLRHVQ